MDLRGKNERGVSLEEQMKRLQKNINHRRARREEGRERRKREHSDEEDEDDEKSGKQQRGRSGPPEREHGQLNVGGGGAMGAALERFKWTCELCNITVGSEALQHQHLQGAAHLKAVTKAAAARDAEGRLENSKAQAALAMASWTAAAQKEADFSSVVVHTEPVKRLDHYGKEIMAKGLVPHCPDSGLVHKGAEYKVIQNKMSAPLMRRPATIQKSEKTSKKAAARSSNPAPAKGPDLEGWDMPLPSGLVGGAAMVSNFEPPPLMKPTTVMKQQETAKASLNLPPVSAANNVSVLERELEEKVEIVRDTNVAEQPEEDKKEESGSEDGGGLGGLMGDYGSDSEDEGDEETGNEASATAILGGKDPWASDGDEEDDGDEGNEASATANLGGKDPWASDGDEGDDG